MLPRLPDRAPGVLPQRPPGRSPGIRSPGSNPDPAHHRHGRQNGSRTAQYVYTPFGVEEPYSASGQPFRYTGQRRDGETGLYYYRARYYDPALGRFLQTDPVLYADQMNLYAYVGNNPLMFTDPSGMNGCITVGGQRFCPVEISQEGRSRINEALALAASNTREMSAYYAKQGSAIASGAGASSEFLSAFPRHFNAGMTPIPSNLPQAASDQFGRIADSLDNARTSNDWLQIMPNEYFAATNQTSPYSDAVADVSLNDNGSAQMNLPMSAMGDIKEMSFLIANEIIHMPQPIGLDMQDRYFEVSRGLLAGYTALDAGANIHSAFWWYRMTQGW
ncbi:MAG: RHS repeat-associated core domain-containing protein [Maricaulaceae bacterium]|nr:RHS repeat-associated core domain-containing protein [Maricaulaceae bacterium]